MEFLFSTSRTVGNLQLAEVEEERENGAPSWQLTQRGREKAEPKRIEGAIKEGLRAV
jgi:hypothetical protein